MTDMTMVFALNMTYDVPVKLLSFHLILMAALLLAPEAKRLANFFVLNRTAEPAEEAPLFQGRRGRLIAGSLIAFLWVWILANDGWMIWRDWHAYGPGAPKSPLYGIWNIESLTLNGHPQSLTVTEREAWHRIIFDRPESAVVECMDDSHRYGATVDQKAGSILLTDAQNKKWQTRFNFGRPAFDQLKLDGTLDGLTASLTLKRLDEKKLLLASRGFHWVQDYPFIK
jgi:hypothetical protein